MHRHIGIYSGTFDPVHAGHIAFAKEAKRLLQLDEIVFLPEPIPRRKVKVNDISHRIKMLDLMIQDAEGLKIIELNTSQFTIKDTLPTLHRLFRATRFVFLIGSDIVPYLHTWNGLSTLLHEATFAICIRSGDSAKEVTKALKAIEKEHNLPVKYTLLATPYAELASSQIRSGNVKNPTLVSYIRKHNLYK